MDCKSNPWRANALLGETHCPTRRGRSAGGSRGATGIPGSCSLMRKDQTELDGHVLATLRAPTLSGVPAVMTPKRISHHIGTFMPGTGWGPTPQAVTAALRRLAARGLVERAGHSSTCWTITSGSRDRQWRVDT